MDVLISNLSQTFRISKAGYRAATYTTTLLSINVQITFLIN